jgi:hypothetical protein
MNRPIGSRALALATVAVHLLSLASCRRDDAQTPERTGAGTSASTLAGLSAVARTGDPEARRTARRALAESGRARQPPLPPVTDTGPLGAHTRTELDQAAKRIIGFLRGEVDVDRIRVADTVTLYLSPEAGGARRKVSREMLRNRSNWTVRMKDLPHARGMTYSFAPPKGTAELTTRVGRHLNCREYPLSWRYKELAQFPHVGTMLTYGRDSCLQTRNLTLVFDPNEKPPTLIAAVYDQWEW